MPFDRSAFRPAIVAALAVLTVQLAFVSWTFPIGALFSDTPLFYIDGAYHWQQVYVARELALQGKLTGYDPFFGAGHLAGVTLNASAKVPSLMAVALGGMFPEATIYKLYVFAAAVVAPILLPLAAGVLRSGAFVIWTTAALGLCAWWATGLRWYHTAGMVSFVLASYFSVLFASLLFRTVLDGPRSRLAVVAAGVLGAAGLFLHPLFPIPVAVAVFCYLGAERRQVRWPHALKVLTAVATLSLVPNLPWVFAMLTADATVVGMSPYQRIVDLTLVPRELAGVWGGGAMGSKLYIGLFVASLFAAFAIADPFLRRFSRASVAAWILLTLLASVGSIIPGVGPLQPNRFSSVAYLFLIPSGALGIQAMIAKLKGQYWTKVALAGVSALVCMVSFAWSAVEVSRELSRAPIGHYGAIPPEVRPIGSRSQWIFDWLLKNTTADGRVLFETSKARFHDGAHMAGYLALATEREFIGGPYPGMFYAGFSDGFAFGESLETFDATRFRAKLALYNVGWIIAHTPASKRFLSSVEGIEALEEHDGVKTYRVRQPLSFFISGSGRVQSRTINHLFLENIQGPEAVLKYHFVPGLIANPPAKVEPYWVPGDDRPFVRLTSVSGPRVELSIQ